MTIYPMNMNELLTQLKTTKDNVGSVLAHGLRDNDNINLLQILETCDISTLVEVKQYMKKDIKDLYDKITERRLRYVNSVRRKCQDEMKTTKNNNSDDKKKKDNFIDLSGNADDTENLACGMTIIYSGIDKITNMIERKKKEIEDERQKLNQPRNIVIFIFLIIGCIIIGLCKSGV